MSRKNCTQIGGSAVIEGVMMRGKSVAATAVRDQKGNIQVESTRFKPFAERNAVYRIPVLRGIVNFGNSMVDSMKYILRSADVFADVESEESKFEKWVSKKFKLDVMDVVTFVAAIIGVLLALFLFVFIPNLISDAIYSGVDRASFGMSVAYNATSGAFRMLIFVIYLVLIRQMKDIKRMFKYHGAEHKTISCYEHNLPLTVDNVRTMTKVHDRCGTTFMFLVMLVSIFFFMLFPVDFIEGGNKILNFVLRVLFRIVFIPVVAGLSYEVLKWLAKYDNLFTKIMKAPGLALQKLTTIEPEDEMIEVAITAFETVLKMEADETLPTTFFDTTRSVDKVKSDCQRMLGKDSESKVETVMMDVLGLTSRGELFDGRKIKEEEYLKIKAAIVKVKKKVPPQYVSGKAYFYGREFSSDQRALIPRQDTEILAEQAIAAIKEKENAKVLELCTGSGAVAVTISLECGVKVIATDISDDALALAKQNAQKFSADVEFRAGDMFTAVKKEEPFDIIVVNPPYIPKKDIQGLDAEVKNYEPELALDGGYDGLDFYRTISANTKDFLADNGVLLMEVGIGQAEQVATLFRDREVVFVKDYNNPPIDRVVIVKGVKNV